MSREMVRFDPPVRARMFDDSEWDEGKTLRIVALEFQSESDQSPRWVYAAPYDGCVARYRPEHVRVKR